MSDQARLGLQRLALGDPELLDHEVGAGHELGHRMLDLDAAVQLQEPEVAAVEHELGRAGAAVADRPRERDRGLAHLRAQLRVERGRGRLLEHLLMAPLNRALALAERDDRALRVAEQLDLDVPRPLDVALAEDPLVAEGRLRLAPRGGERLVQLGRLAHDAHPAAAAARSRLDDEREADLVGSPSGTTGTPASRAMRFASSLSPPARSASGGGPTHVSPAASTASAKSAFSARKP